MRILLIFILSLLSCCCSPANSTRATTSAENIEFSGKVIYVALEGGFWGLEDQSGSHYLPDKIPAELRIDGQPVRVKARPAPPAVGFRMWGKRIIIEEISSP